MGLISYLEYLACFWRGHLAWHITGRYQPAPWGALYRCSTCDRTWRSK